MQTYRRKKDSVWTAANDEELARYVEAGELFYMDIAQKMDKNGTAVAHRIRKLGLTYAPKPRPPAPRSYVTPPAPRATGKLIHRNGKDVCYE